MNFRSLEEFWPFFMNQHSKPSTRRWHFVGTLASILCFIYSVCFNWWFLLFVPLLGYGLGWYSHFFVEGNVPAAFGHPFWSLLCDLKMFALMLTGQMDREIKRLGKRPILQFVVKFMEKKSNMFMKRARIDIELNKSLGGVDGDDNYDGHVDKDDGEQGNDIENVSFGNDDDFGDNDLLY